jgi:SAM-dependent methyltransferase
MIEKIINAQYRRPNGWLGQFIGNRMARDHKPENLWTVSLLQAEPTDHILEIGFGAGVAIQELAGIITQGCIAGIDFSKTMVDAARRRNATAIRHGCVDLRYGDAVDLPFADNAFDKAFSIHSIYFWPQPLKVLEEVGRVLKSNGMLAITILPKEKWNANNPNTPVGTPDCKPYSGGELAHLLTTAGFSHIQIQTDTNPAYRSNFSVIGLR